VDDDLLLAAVEPKVAVLIGTHHVAGVQPAVDHRCRSRPRIVPVADHVAGKFDPEAPGRAARHLAPVVVAQRGLVAGTEAPDRADLRRCRWIDGRNADLGHPVTLVDHDAGKRGELLLEGRGNLVATRITCLDRGKIRAAGAVIASQRVERRGQHPHLGRPFLAQQWQDFVAIERARHDDPAAGGERHHRQVVAADMRCRATGQHDVVWTHVPAPDGTGNDPAQRLNAVADALRLAGAARRGENDRRVFRLRRDEIAARLGFRQRPEARAIASAIVFIADPAERQLAREFARGQVFPALVMGEQDLCPADAECMVNLRCHIAVVQRHRDQAALHAGEVMDQQLRAVRHQRRDPVTRLEAEAEVVAGQTGRGGIEHPPRPAPPARDQRVRIRLRIETPLKYLREVDGSIQRRSGNRHGDPAFEPDCERIGLLTIAAAKKPQKRDAVSTM
jgi:hypothetical protein